MIICDMDIIAYDISQRISEARIKVSSSSFPAMPPAIIPAIMNARKIIIGAKTAKQAENLIKEMQIQNWGTSIKTLH